MKSGIKQHTEEMKPFRLDMKFPFISDQLNIEIGRS
jgi:hypothetical protein